MMKEKRQSNKLKQK